jgi:hypothetical protein
MFLPFQIVPTQAARDAIPAVDRATGMVVVVAAGLVAWQLAADLVTWAGGIAVGPASLDGTPGGEETFSPFTLTGMTAVSTPMLEAPGFSAGSGGIVLGTGTNDFKTVQQGIWCGATETLNMPTAGSFPDVQLPQARNIGVYPAAGVSIAGIDPAPGEYGREVTLINVGDHPFTILNKAPAAAAGKQIVTGTGGTLTVGIDGAVRLLHIGAGKWRVV